MGLERVKAVVADLWQALTQRRFRTWGRAFTDGMRRDIRRAFDTGSDPVTGNKWPALTYRKGDPLVLSGKLRAGAYRAVDEAQPTPAGVRVNLVDPPYGVFHQLGTKRTPRRRFFGISAETARDARRAFAGELAALLVSGQS